MSKIFRGLIFALVLVLAWMFLGGSSGYYDTAPGTVAAATGAAQKGLNRVRGARRRARGAAQKGLKRVHGRKKRTARSRNLKPKRVCMEFGY